MGELNLRWLVLSASLPWFPDALGHGKHPRLALSLITSISFSCERTLSPLLALKLVAML